MAWGEESGERGWEGNTLLLAGSSNHVHGLCVMPHHLPPTLDVTETTFCFKTRCRAGISWGGRHGLMGQC